MLIIVRVGILRWLHDVEFLINWIDLVHLLLCTFNELVELKVVLVLQQFEFQYVYLLLLMLLLLVHHLHWKLGHVKGVWDKWLRLRLKWNKLLLSNWFCLNLQRDRVEFWSSKIVLSLNLLVCKNFFWIWQAVRFNYIFEQKFHAILSWWFFHKIFDKILFVKAYLWIYPIFLNWELNIKFINILSFFRIGMIMWAMGILTLVHFVANFSFEAHWMVHQLFSSMNVFAFVTFVTPMLVLS